MRYLTEDLPGVGGEIKHTPEDFRVEEIPLYGPAGDGEHTLFEVEKVGLSTFEMIRQIARALGISARDVGYAGLKDAHAVALQHLTVLHVPPADVRALDVPGVRVLWATRHRNKLKIGHLAGNRFILRVRGVDVSALPRCRAILDVLTRRGVPNAYGPQRFGIRGDSHLLGRALVLNDARAFVSAYLGNPHPAEHETVATARRRFERGDWEKALPAFPGSMPDERRVLHTLLRTGGDARRAMRSLSKRMRLFLVSAYQAALFNRVLEARLDTLDQVFEGDLAVKHPGRAVFRVMDVGAEQPRAARFEISPSGPIFGHKMIQPTGRPAEVEQSVLDEDGLRLDSFRVAGGLRVDGTRRALRFSLLEPAVWFDDGLMLRFELPRGSYATAVLGEVMKVDLGTVAGLDEPGDADVPS
jgi:tRNA pseudouridine13 synthase